MAAKIGVLIRMYKGHCHYCGCKVTKSDAGKYPTRDHVVPRAFGGHNGVDNFVLSCYDCNQKRGTSLFFCKCQDCGEKILDALYEGDIVNNIFSGLISHNKPRVSKVDAVRNGEAGIGRWRVRIGHSTKRFLTYEEAIAFALGGTFTKDRDYNG